MAESPGSNAAGLYTSGQAAEAALRTDGGRTDDKEALIKAMRTVALTDTPRGPFHFDRFGNVVGDFFIRRCEKREGKLVKTTIRTYHAVSQSDLRRGLVPCATSRLALLPAAADLNAARRARRTGPRAECSSGNRHRDAPTSYLWNIIANFRRFTTTRDHEQLFVAGATYRCSVLNPCRRCAKIHPGPWRNPSWVAPAGGSERRCSRSARPPLEHTIDTTIVRRRSRRLARPCCRLT